MSNRNDSNIKHSVMSLNLPPTHKIPTRQSKKFDGLPVNCDSYLPIFLFCFHKRGRTLLMIYEQQRSVELLALIFLRQILNMKRSFTFRQYRSFPRNQTDCLRVQSTEFNNSTICFGQSYYSNFPTNRKRSNRQPLRVDCIASLVSQYRYHHDFFKPKEHS